VENSGKKATRAALVFLPILVAGTMANNRRLAWVQVGLVFVTVYIVSRPTPFKRLIRRTVLAILPVAVVYLALGWNVQYSTVFKPVKMIRSVVDAKSDGSSEWRELENYDLIMTYRDHSLFGVGFGNPYEEIVVLPKVNYSLERFAPHNSLLGVWCFTGVVGFAGLTLLWISGVYFAMRAYYHSTDRTHRVAALVSFAAVLVYMLQSWGDLGLASTNGAFIMGCALACAGKLAAANGQWGTPTRAPAPSKPASVQA
jgi:O-antigen ligase